MISDTTSTLPADRAYDAGQHLWVVYDAAANCATVGVDVLGQATMGDLAYLKLAPVGTAVRRGASAGSLEAAKMTGDVVSPLTGTVVAINEAALRDPSLVNHDPYGAGWLLMIAPADWAGESGALVAGAAVAGWASSEIARYREEGWLA